jgi:hypothetical protein
MARANRIPGVNEDGGGIYHLTHRCHNRAFLLRFACDRDAYRKLVWEHLRRFRVAVLDYCVTANHVHLLVDLERLCWRLQASNLDELRKGLVASLAEKIAREEVKREPCWTENLAVGSRGFVE